MRAEAISSGVNAFHAWRRTCGTTCTGAAIPLATKTSRLCVHGTPTSSARSSSGRQCAGSRSVSHTVMPTLRRPGWNSVGQCSGTVCAITVSIAIGRHVAASRAGRSESDWSSVAESDSDTVSPGSAGRTSSPTRRTGTQRTGTPAFTSARTYAIPARP